MLIYKSELNKLKVELKQAEIRIKFQELTRNIAGKKKKKNNHFLRCITDRKDDKEGITGIRCKISIAYNGTEGYVKELMIRRT